MDSVILVGINAGLSHEAIMDMTLGQVVDFAIEKYNNDHADEKKKRGKTVRKRKATQADYDALFG